MALIKCKECGSGVSTQAAACPKCGAPLKSQSQGGGCGTVLLALAIIIAGFFLAPSGTFDSLIKTVQSKAGGSSAATPVFPVGSYKYGRATYVSLNSDSTFNVKSDDLLVNCKGTWSFDGETLSMHADADEGGRKFLPYIFYTPAKLLSRGDELVVWDCLEIYRFEWKKIDRQQ